MPGLSAISLDASKIFGSIESPADGPNDRKPSGLGIGSSLPVLLLFAMSIMINNYNYNLII